MRHAIVQTLLRQINARILFFTLVASCLIPAFSLVALLQITSWVGREKLPFENLLEHQRAKLGSDLAPIVFLGDSSLGNAINIEAWERETGQAAVNLALTGYYGYDGTLAMLRRLVGKPVQVVVIMQTADMLARSRNPQAPEEIFGAQATFRRIGQWWETTVNLVQIESTLKFIAKQLLIGLGLRPWLKAKGIEFSVASAIVNDYIRQGSPVMEPFEGKLDINAINKEQLGVLAQISQVCSQIGVRCIYAHGPLASPRCENSANYFDAARKMIVDAGLVVASGTPVCISPDELGDSVDHVAPQQKDIYTIRYADLLRPMLNEMSPNVRPGLSP